VLERSDGLLAERIIGRSMMGTDNSSLAVAFLELIA
jgi:hypothetical protein